MKKSFINRAAAKFFAAGTAAALALGFALTGCSSAADAKPKIRIGIKYDQPGLGYQDGRGIHRLRRGYCEVYCG